MWTNAKFINVYLSVKKADTYYKESPHEEEKESQKIWIAEK